jgi:membrane-bound lytic murein transglycosylase D
MKYLRSGWAIVLVLAARLAIGQPLPTHPLPFLPDTLTFAGEAVPMNDPAVRDRLERELIRNVYRHSSTLAILKRVPRYREPIVRILTARQVPADFFYVAVIESELSPLAESGKAVGWWQFIEATAREQGLEMNRYVDERRHLERSTEAAARQFTLLNKTFANWTLSAAAYNGGRSMVLSNLKAQQVSSFYDLYLTPETYDYVFRVLAMKLILEHPGRYGFSAGVAEYQPPTQEVEVKQDVNLVELARRYRMTYNQLKYLNPWLLYRSAWTPADKYFEQNKTFNLMLEVPPGKGYLFRVLK